MAEVINLKQAKRKHFKPKWSEEEAIMHLMRFCVEHLKTEKHTGGTFLKNAQR